MRPSHSRRCRSAPFPLISALVLLVLAPAGLGAQGQQPLLKSDLIRLLSTGTLPQEEITALVRRNCVAFRPTERDREDLRSVGAEPALIEAIDGCSRREAAPAVRIVPDSRRLAVDAGGAVMLRVTVYGQSAAAGITVTVQDRGILPPESDLRAVTDRRGAATLRLVAPERAGSYAIAVAAVEDDRSVARTTVTLEVSAGPPARAETEPSRLSLRVGSRESGRLAARIVDRFGNPVTGEPVELRSIEGDLDLPEETRTTGSDGQVEFRFDTRGLRGAGAIGLYARGQRLASVPASILPGEVSASTTRFIAGAGQSGEPGTELPEPLVLAVRDSFGNPIPDREVRFSAEGAELDRDAAVTDSAGRARVGVRLGPSPRPATVTARVGDVVVRAELKIDPARASDLADRGVSPVAAEAHYDSVLAADPHNIEALRGRAFARSWQGKQAEAQEDFRAVLVREPDDVTALSGLGYSLAWSGQYDEAEYVFRRLAAVAPDRLDGPKGLAYVALWRGRPGVAVERFATILEEHPENAEAATGLGYALIESNRPRTARRYFERALELQPDRTDARQGLEATWYSPSMIEFELWAGYTAFGGEALSGDQPPDGRAGIRYAEVGVWATPDLRLRFRYDNGLSMDNARLALDAAIVPSYETGALFTWGGKHISHTSFGVRDLDDAGTEFSINAGHAVVFPNASAINAGGAAYIQEGAGTDLLLHAGGRLPVGDRFGLEPTLFVSTDAQGSGTHVRGLLAGTYRFSGGLEVRGGFAGGSTEVVPGDSRRLVEGYFGASFPIGVFLERVQLFARHQAIESGPGITVLAIGFRTGPEYLGRVGAPGPLGSDR